MGGNSQKEELKERIDMIKEQIDGTTSEYDKDKL